MKYATLLICFFTGIYAYAQPPLVFTNFDLQPGSVGSDAGGFANLYGKMYFSAYGADGIEPYISDGTVAGTYYMDIQPGGGSSYPGWFTGMGGKVYFAANDGSSGTELWVTDGTTAGTHMVSDIFPGLGNAGPSSLMECIGKLFFDAQDGTHGSEPFVSDGTAAGTQMLADIMPGPASSGAHAFAEINGKVCFVAKDIAHGEELWVTDGTAAGTQLLKDINPGAAGSYTAASALLGYEYARIGNMLLFGADDGTHGFELWVTDGTPTGTHMVRDINTGPATGLSGQQHIVFKGRLYFNATSSDGDELWTTDGTDTGTYMVKDINPGAGSSQVMYYTQMNGRMYFGAGEGTHGYELWTSDGTAAGTYMVKDILPGSGNGRPERIITYKNHIYFAAQTPGAETKLWQSDGTDAGTHIIAPASATVASPLQTFYDFHVFDTTLYVVANFDTTGYELWSIYDAGPDGISQIKTVLPASVYPNPATKDAMLSLELKQALKLSVQLTDISGHVLYTKAAQPYSAGKQLLVLPTGSYPAGMYIYTLRDETGQLMHSGRLVKE